MANHFVLLALLVAFAVVASAQLDRRDHHRGHRPHHRGGHRPHHRGGHGHHHHHGPRDAAKKDQSHVRRFNMVEALEGGQNRFNSYHRRLMDDMAAQHGAGRDRSRPFRGQGMVSRMHDRLGYDVRNVYGAHDLPDGVSDDHPNQRMASQGRRGAHGNDRAQPLHAFGHRNEHMGGSRRGGRRGRPIAV